MELVWKHPFSPYARINQVPIDQIRQKLIEVFNKWGKAGCFRVDNGEPFGSPAGAPTPPLALWLIAHDIDLTWNKPYCPQMNNRVEKMQDTTQRWAEVQACRCLQELQAKLDAQIHIQRQLYPVTRLEGKTRAMAFPELITKQRVFSSKDFDSKRVQEFIAKKIYTRKVSSVGQITHFGQTIRVGKEFAHQFVQLKFKPDTLQWQISNSTQIIKNIADNCLTDDRIKNMTVFSKQKKQSN